MAITKSIKAIRKHWRENQEVFGQHFGLTRFQVRNYEGGTNTPSIDFMVKLEELSGIAVSDLYHGTFDVGDVPVLPGRFDLVGQSEGMVMEPKQPDDAKGAAPVDLAELAKLIKQLQADMKKENDALKARLQWLENQLKDREGHE